jgi:hypothetical protein
MPGNEPLLADLVNMDNPVSVYEEIKTVIALTNGKFDFSRLDQVFADTVMLYQGEYPGYRQCTTHYHDLHHTTDTFLALARLIHGAHASGIRFRDRNVELALISALLHDSGYIQTMDDHHGTGGKYTVTHVERSIEFISRYLATHGYSKSDYETCRIITRCTCHYHGLGTIRFSSAEREMLGKMTGTADLIGQFADRLYLEKLLFLYREFREAQVMGFESELDLLKKTINFFESAQNRLKTELGDMNRFMRYHFHARWHIDRDLYRESIDSNLDYLALLVRNHERDYRLKLKRGGILTKLVRHEELEKTRPSRRSPS